MELNDEYRRALAELFRGLRRRPFGDDKKAAYTAARVNSATWDRLENAQPVRDATLSRALRNLLPHTNGDWESLINEDGLFVTRHPKWVVGGAPQDASYVASPGPRVDDGVSLEEVLAELRAVRERLEALERQQGS